LLLLLTSVARRSLATQPIEERTSFGFRSSKQRSSQHGGTKQNCFCTNHLNDSRRVLGDRDFLPQFTHKGKTWIVLDLIKEAKNWSFRKNDVPIMRDVPPSETIQLSFILEILENRTLTEPDRSDCTV
jgi:hypothetical protein